MKGAKIVMKASVMRAKTARGKMLAAKEGMDLMWRDHQWDNSKGVSPFFINHVPDYSGKIEKRTRVVAVLKKS